MGEETRKTKELICRTINNEQKFIELGEKVTSENNSVNIGIQD